MSENKIGIVLSGGGIKGAAHIGVLQALEENNIKISAIAGTSIGGIVGSFYAMQYKPKEMLQIFTEYAKEILRAEPNHIIGNVRKKRSILGTGLLSGQKIENLITEYAKNKNITKINDIKMPLSMPAVDIINNREYIFTNRKIDNRDFIKDKKGIRYINNIEIGRAARATASYPGVFSPCEYQSYKFVDGSLLDNVPVAEIDKLGVDKILTIKFPPEMIDNLNHMYEVIFKSIEVMSDQIDKKKTKKSDFVLNIYLKSSYLFNVKKINYCYEQGYINAISQMQQIKETLLS